MRVLLISPIDPKVPGNLKFLMGGENTYTRTLLANPPPSVEYVHYVEALKKGEIRHRFFRQILQLLTKFRVLPLSAGTFDIEVLGNFDLVHCHAYTLRLDGRSRQHLPVVMGDSVPNRWALSSYFHQRSLRVEASYNLRQIVHRALGVFDQDLSLGNYSSLIVMSEFAKREHLKLGADLGRIAVIYPGLADRGERLSKSKSKRKGVRFLFAGVWFERKGGLILWEAYQRVRVKLGEKVGLTILGPLPKKLKSQSSPKSFATGQAKLKSLGILQHDFVSYDRLVGEFYPNADVLVHVPPKAEGYGLVVEEAMSFGIPVIASKVGALSEMVVDGKTGLLVEPGSVDSLEKALIRLVEDESLRERMSRSARRRFKKQFSLPVMHRKLLKIYKEAVRLKTR